MLIARTDSKVPKHQGITYFTIDMDQPGIDVRPIKEMTGAARFSEVFFDDARIPVGNEIGGINAGWRVAQTTLANERSGLAGGNEAVGGAPGGSKRGVLHRRAGDLSRGRRPSAGTSGVFATRGSGLLIKVAQERGVNKYPITRQGLARLYVLEQIRKYTAMRAKAAVQSGRSPGPEVSTQKLNMSRIVRTTRDVGMSILGAQGLLQGETSVTGGSVQEMFLMSPAPSIYGGTDQIQKNIIGEPVLGLPKEPFRDKEVPFEDLLHTG